MSGTLEKMRLIAYSDEGFNEQVADGEFTVQVNPEAYSFKYKVEQDDQQAAGTSGTNLRFNRILPQEMSFDFLFDATGAIPAELSPAYSNRYSYEDGIVDALEHFKGIVLDYQGDSHQPNYVKLVWGTLLFKGRLTELDIDFKLFRPDGTPLRAMAKAKFSGSVEDDLRTAQENAQSPDLTHQRTVRDDDRLDSLCHCIYGDPGLYLEAARTNGLTSLRHLRTGDTLLFPPVEK